MQSDIKQVQLSVLTCLFIKTLPGEKTEKFVKLLATREKLSLSLSLLPSVRHDDHVRPVPKKVADEKSKQENNERGQEEDK